MLLTRRSQNYLSGDAARMDGAAGLANGSFSDPGQLAINELADTEKVEVKIQFYVPGSDVIIRISVSALEAEAAKEFPSTVLVFTGNSITSTGSDIPPSPAGKLCQVDRVQQVEGCPCCVDSDGCFRRGRTGGMLVMPSPRSSYYSYCRSCFRCTCSPGLPR